MVQLKPETARHEMWIVWFTLCSLTGSRCNQQGLWLSGLICEEAHPVVPDIAQSRFKSVDAECLHRPLVQRIPSVYIFEKNIWLHPLCNGSLPICMCASSTLPICIQDKEVIKRNSTKYSVHFENVNQVLIVKEGDKILKCKHYKV